MDKAAYFLERLTLAVYCEVGLHVFAEMVSMYMVSATCIILYQLLINIMIQTNFGPLRRDGTALHHFPPHLRVCPSENGAVLLVITEQTTVHPLSLMDRVDSVNVGLIKMHELICVNQISTKYKR
jgi:hypothetical protein